jgi:hypothetical protein
MNFKPKTEKELAEEALLQKGVYAFSISEAKETTSKKGDQMIAMTLDIWEGETKRATVYDYLVEEMRFKLRHLCDGVDLMDKYNSGTITAGDLIGKAGNCKIDIKPPQGDYKAKNVIKDYMVKGEKSDMPF